MARAKEKVDFERGAHAHRPGAADERRRPRRAAYRDSRRSSSSCRRFPASARRIRRCPTTSPPSGRRSRPSGRRSKRSSASFAAATDYANLLPGRAVGSRLSEAAERARADAARVVRRAAVGDGLSRRRSHRTRFAYPAGQLRHAWKTLLQNHPHDSICGCSIDAVHEENMTRFARARQVGDAVVETALDAIADSVPRLAAPACHSRGRRQHRRRRARAGRRGVHRSAGRQRGAVAARSTRRRSIGRSRSGRASRRSPASPDRTASASSSRFSARNRSSRHVMSRYETPWALNVRRLHLLWWAPALPPCGYAAFDLTIGIGRRRRCPAAGAWSAAATSSPRTNGSRCPVNHDGTFEVSDKATGVTYHRVGGDRGRRRRRRRVQLLAARVGSPRHQRRRARHRRLAHRRRSAARRASRRARAAAAAIGQRRSQEPRSARRSPCR